MTQPRPARWTLSVAAAVLALAAGCSPAPTPPSVAGSPPPSPQTASPSASSPASPPTAASRPIVITTDLAADDLLAVMALLREPAVDVLAIAVDGNGEVHCAPGLRSMRRLLGAFGRSDVRIGCGRDQPGEHGRLFPDEWRAGADNLYGVELPAIAGTSLGEDAPTMIADVIAGSPEPVTLVPIGTWTSIADAFAADPSLAGRVAGIHAMAGAIDVPGNISVGDVTPEHGVEWNVGVDPDAVAAVLATEVPITLVPLDATNDVPVPPDFAEILETDHAAAGADIAFEMYARSPFLTVDVWFWDTLAAMALVDPTLVGWEDLTARVELGGPSSGRFVRDPEGRPIRAAMSADRDAFMAALLAALRRGDPRPEPFTVTGTLEVGWDGTTCSIAGAPPSSPGTTRLTVENRSDLPVNVVLATVEPPRTWADAAAFLATIDPSDPALEIPDWLQPLDGGASAGGGQEGSAFVALPAGEIGAACIAGEWPDVRVLDAGSFAVGG